MKKILPLFSSVLLFFSILLFETCKKEDFLQNIPNQDEVKSTVKGVVFSYTNNFIANATIKVGNQTVMTNDYGYFDFGEIIVDKRSVTLTIEKEGFFTDYKKIYPISKGIHFVESKLVNQRNASRFLNTEGGIVKRDGAELNFSPNAVKYKDGSPYTGNVNVYLRWINPLSEDIEQVVPGDFTGVNMDLEDVVLKSYGMIDVKLYTDADEPLQLVEELPATIKMTIPDALLETAPSSIPLWHFDEEIGTWKEEGEAIKEGDKYIGEVTHFSLWNCDESFLSVYISGRLVDATGEPLSQMTMTASATGVLNQNFTTLVDGEFAGLVPIDEIIMLQLYSPSDCDEDLAPVSIGPFLEDTEVGDIVVPLTIDFFTVSGKALDCNSNPLVNSTAYLYSQGRSYTQTTNEQGDFTFTFPFCLNSLNETFNLIIYEEEGEQWSPVIAINTSDEPSYSVDIGQIPVCIQGGGVYLNTEIEFTTSTYSMSGTYENNIVFLNPEGHLAEVDVNGDSIYWPKIGKYWSSFFSFPSLEVGVYNGADFVFKLVYYDSYGQRTDPVCLEDNCPDLTLSITENEGLGGFVTGTIIGTYPYENDYAEFGTATIDVSFRVYYVE